MALTAGFEPAASPLGGEHSIQLSYASNIKEIDHFKNLPRIYYLETYRIIAIIRSKSP